MKDSILRQKDILRLIEGLDISPTMFKNATEKYSAVSLYLQATGLKCDVFPQGSFSLGTVVRPYRQSKEADYDLDFVCCINEAKNEVLPENIKNIVKDTLCTSEYYRDVLQDIEWDKCWTLKFPEIGEIGFNIDIVPAVPETSDIIDLMISEDLTQEQAELAVAITNKKDEKYSWLTSNPRAYKEWFQNINKPFLEHNREIRKQALFEKCSHVYNSIEEIPQELERSSLQRVIQILKHHRDVYYCRINKEDMKPTSAIITTLCAQIARNINPQLNVFELLMEIVEDFEIYSQNQIITESEFSFKYKDKNLIRKLDEKWYIINPVNKFDNLADSWNDGSNKAALFFKWIASVKRDFLDSLNVDDNDFVALLENNFGRDYVKHSINLNEYNSAPVKIITSTPKPWRK